MMISPMVFEIVYVLVLLIGIWMVWKSPGLVKPYKCLWTIVVLLFNLLSVIIFLIYGNGSIEKNMNNLVSRNRSNEEFEHLNSLRKRDVFPWLYGIYIFNSLNGK